MSKGRFKYVSLFSGIGGFDEPINNLGGECVLASEIDKYADQGYEALFGHKTIGDVMKIDAKDVPEHGLLVGGFPCFKRGTLVTTSEGLKKIEEVKKGDLVLTHKNRFKKVVVPMVKEKEGIYRLKVQGSPETYVTEEHPIYVRTIDRVTKEKGKTELVYGEPKWIEVEELDKDRHYIGMTSNFESKNEKELDEIDLWLMGRYMADGYVQDSKRIGRKNSYNNKVIIRVGKDKLKYFKENAEGKYRITYRDNGSVMKCIITDMNLMNLCKDIGRGLHNKEIPGYILNLPVKSLEVFLDGYMSGDGGVRGDTKYAVSESEKLIYGLGSIVTKLYKTPYSINKVEMPDKTIIEGREVNQRDYWRITYREQDNPRQQGYYHEGMLWMPIREIEYEEDFKDDVYNFEVEDDNSYVVYNKVVHNCQAFSQSGLREGFNDARGTLFFEIARIAKEKQPKVLLLENVKGLVNHDDGKTIRVMVDVLNEIGYRVDFEVLNSKHFGVPQSRERIFIVAVREDLVEQRGWVIRGNTVSPTAKRMLNQNRELKTFNFNFPRGEDVRLSVKDIMEDEVDERYYVTKESAQKLIEELKKRGTEKEKQKSRKIPSLFNRPTRKIDEDIAVVGSLDKSGLESNNRVYSKDGIAPTIMTRGECYILEDDPGIDVVGRVHKGMSGVVYGENGITPTLTTEGGCMVAVNNKDKIDVVGTISKTQRGLVHDSDGLVGAIMASDYRGSKNILEEKGKDMYIRRLTPKEYLRLQAFPEGTYERLREVGISDSQIYKQAGNAVTLTVIDALVRTIISEGYLD